MDRKVRILRKLEETIRENNKTHTFTFFFHYIQKGDIIVIRNENGVYWIQDSIEDCEYKTTTFATVYSSQCILFTSSYNPSYRVKRNDYATRCYNYRLATKEEAKMFHIVRNFDKKENFLLIK